MLRQTSKKFRDFFLLQFTNQLIQHSGGEVLELEGVLNKGFGEKKKWIKQRVEHTLNSENLGSITQELEGSEPQNLIGREDVLPEPLAVPMHRVDQGFVGGKKPPQGFARRTLRPILRIPEPRFPLRLQYLKPIPTNVEIDIGKLNPLARDPMVEVIECDGPGKSIIVKGAMGSKTTKIILTKEEIEQIVQNFSETAKIPLYEGVFRVVVGRLILLAIISGVVSSKFIIKKMKYFPRPPSPSFSR